MSSCTDRRQQEESTSYQTMQSNADARRVAEIMLSWIGLQPIRVQALQRLWAGYGQICALSAIAKDDESAKRWSPICGGREGSMKDPFLLILKLISPGVKPGADRDEGHLRKMFSYEVEQYFYDHVAPQLPSDVAVATSLVSTRDMSGREHAHELRGLTAIVMTDLRPEFPVKGEGRAVLSSVQVESALNWLAKFHRSSWVSPIQAPREEFLLPPLEEARRRQLKADGPDSGGRRLWLNGGYTYLATRRSEYDSLSEDSDSEWSQAFCRPADEDSASIAEMVASVLAPRGRPVETYIHGDVKSENLFAVESGKRVCFFDFQYAGLGLGVCDLAKLFTCSVSLNQLTSDWRDVPDVLPMDHGERALLEKYRAGLLQEANGGLRVDYSWDVFVRHWEAALVDWCRFQASWGFWGNTEWLEARVRSILQDEEWLAWLRADLKERS